MTAPAFFLGSLPYKDVETALQFVRDYSGSLPFLPQLPGANRHEEMIAQALRGFDLKAWDEKCSVSLEPFLNEYKLAVRTKIQVAGPFTVSWFISRPFDEIRQKWLAWWSGFAGQLQKAGLQGELWLQIDEPFWSSYRALPVSYPEFLAKVREGRRGLVLGVHSCAPERAEIPDPIWLSTDFLSLEFSATAMTEAERKKWEKALSEGKRLIAGILPKGKKEPLWKNVVSADSAHGNLWYSAPCGLYHWTPEEIKAAFKPVKK